MEEVARRGVAGAVGSVGVGIGNDPEAGEANDKILYVEGYPKIDFDGDGEAELRKVCTIGPGFYAVYNKPAPERPFALFCPDPEPHTMLGQSWADRLMDLQRLNSALWRGMLDSLSASIFPRTAYVEGQASVADIINTAIGAPMRERVSGAIRPFAHPFVGKEAAPIAQMVRDIVERRIGRDNGAGGLDADALQSMDKQGVQAAISGSQEQAEMLARLFAEQAFKPMFKGLLRLLIEKQPRERMVRLRGHWVDVKPDAWDANMDVRVNVALGMANTEKKISVLMEVSAMQKEILQTYGEDNPVVTLPMWVDTVAKILALKGLRDTPNYFKPLPPNWQPPPPQPPPPSPEQALAQAQVQAQQMKTQGDLTIQKDKLALEEKKADQEFAFKMHQAAADIEIRKYQIDAQFHANMTQAQLDANIQTEVKETELTMAGHDQLHDQAMAEAEHEHTVNMDTRAADTADAAQQAQAAQGPAE
jgi:hypothetical protein